MIITLNRYATNRTCCHGVLTLEDGSEFETLERAVPRDGKKYLKHCLPPGRYKLRVERSVISLEKGQVRRPWLFMERVPFFPHAQIITSNMHDCVMQAGNIFVGMKSDDEWSVEPSDVVTAKIITQLEKIYDSREDCSTEPVELVITEADDMIFNDYDKASYDRAIEAEREEQERLAAEEYLATLTHDEWEDGDFDDTDDVYEL